MQNGSQSQQNAKPDYLEFGIAWNRFKFIQGKFSAVAAHQLGQLDLFLSGEPGQIGIRDQVVTMPMILGMCNR